MCSSADSPLSVLHDDASIRGDPPAAAGVDDQVPVEGRFVRAPRLGIALPEREVNSATDLLVVKDAPREPVDSPVQPEPELAEPASPGVEVEHRGQVILASLGTR